MNVKTEDFKTYNQNCDVIQLRDIGYRQELRRSFSTLEVFGIAYSIMGILPSLSSLAGTAYMAGPGGALWSWFLASIFIFSIGTSLAELASAVPTSGGLYYWTFHYAPKKYRVPISFIIGFSNTMALCCGFVSIGYANAEQIMSVVYIAKNGNLHITRGILYGIFCGCVFLQTLCTCLSSRRIALLQRVSSISHTAIVIVYFIALPIGTSRQKQHFNNGYFIFGQFNDFSDWPIGFQFVLSMTTAIYAIGAFDCCIHMSEEAKDASSSVPKGIMGSAAISIVFGFFIIICTSACMNSNILAIINTPTGFPIAQVIYDSLGKSWAVAIMTLMSICQWFIGASGLTALSRQVWAFARDDGLPFSSFFKVVNKRAHVPIRAVLFAACVALVLGCICFGGSTVSNAFFTLSVSGNYLAWGVPILLRLTTGRRNFVPGKFYLGSKLSTLNSWISCLWAGFVIVISMFPTNWNVKADTMNYTCVIFCCQLLFAFVYYYTVKYRYFQGPKSNLLMEDDGIKEVQKIEA